MRLSTVTWREDAGWSAELSSLPADNAATWVLGTSAGERIPTTALAELRSRFPCAAFTACSTSGCIQDAEISDDPLVATVIEFERTTPAVITEAIADHADSAGLGRRIAEAAVATQEEMPAPLAAVLIFSDGLNINGTGLVAGLNQGLPEGVPLSGGLAGDGSRFKRTWVDDGSGPKEGVVSAVALYSNHLVLSYGSQGGWEAFGPTRTVTRSRGNVLFELDNRRALELYQEYLGDRVAELPASALLYPLALVDDPENILPRTVLSVDKTNQSMTFAGDVPEGARTRLMRTSMELLIDGAHTAAQEAHQTGERRVRGDTLALTVSCVGRRLVLGQRTDDELEVVAAEIGDVAMVGYYSYGEISPVSGDSALHNQTMTLTVIAEET
jgi:hypothetical protein